MNRIFLPLRSNCGWFVDEEFRSEFVMRLKNCVVIYDEIVIQDGRYIYRGGKTENFDLFLPADQSGRNRREHTICKTGQEFGVTIGDKKIIWGTAEVAYETDFYPFIYDAGIVEKEYIKWLPADLPDEVKSTAKKVANFDIEDDELKQYLPETYYQQKNVLESLYFDAFLSNHMNLPFLTDYRMTPIIQWKNKQVGMHFDKTVQDILLSCWISIGLPDFGALPWEKVIMIRESRAGQDFRNMVGQISSVVINNYQYVKNEIELELLVQRILSQELVRQLRAKLPKPQTAFFNLGLNLIPWGGGVVLGGGKDLKDLIEKRNSWVSLIELKPY
ncbi:MAG TPA: hypothetical protein PLX02_14295 [Syntrophorhabdaceae bacterium]|nr:hypothetical protein [Syntrophorhabdaceae bacterium]HQM82779.1 hypothetical protein [Syntrophorhabdaceae bacterium]